MSVNSSSQQPGSYFPGDELPLAALLDDFLASLAEDLRRQSFSTGIWVLLLAGGYGRGEGGVFRADEDAEPQLYNDLEFYLLVKDGARVDPLERWCAAQSHRGDEALGIEVEFKILSEKAFRAAEPSMFYYDLLAAHRVVFGPADFGATLPERLRDPALIPMHEATRLLFNRGTGLFYSLVALREKSQRATNGFIERNHAKVRLALADSVLAVQGRYHFSCRERHQRLIGNEPGKWSTPPDWQKLIDWHAEGVEFKLHPRHRHPSLSTLEQTQEELADVWMRTFFWLESARLERSFGTVADYAHYRGRLFPGTNPMRNVALHCRDRIRRGAALPGMFDYPRATLQRALVLLLAPGANLEQVGRLLGSKGLKSLPGLQDAYERWWRYYN